MNESTEITTLFHLVVYFGVFLCQYAFSLLYFIIDDNVDLIATNDDLYVSRFHIPGTQKASKAGIEQERFACTGSSRHSTNRLQNSWPH